jgi:hypothetical protein
MISKMRRFLFAIVLASYSIICSSQIIDINTGFNFSGVTYTGLQKYGYYITDGLVQSVIYPEEVKYKCIEFNLMSLHGSCISAIFNKSPFMIGDYLGFDLGLGYIASNSKYAVKKVTSNMYSGSKTYDYDQVVNTHISVTGGIDYGLMMRIRPSNDVAFGVQRYYHHTYSRAREGNAVTPVVTGLWGGFSTFFFKIGMNLKKEQKYFNGSYFDLELKNRIGDISSVGIKFEKVKYEGINFITFNLQYGLFFQ